MCSGSDSYFSSNHFNQTLIYVRDVKNDTHPMRVSTANTVNELKNLIVNKLGLSGCCIELTCKTTSLLDPQCRLYQCGIQNGDEIAISLCWRVNPAHTHTMETDQHQAKLYFQ